MIPGDLIQMTELDSEYFNAWDSHWMHRKCSDWEGQHVPNTQLGIIIHLRSNVPAQDDEALVLFSGPILVWIWCAEARVMS